MFNMFLYRQAHCVGLVVFMPEKNNKKKKVTKPTSNSMQEFLYCHLTGRESTTLVVTLESNLGGSSEMCGHCIEGPGLATGLGRSG